MSKRISASMQSDVVLKLDEIKKLAEVLGNPEKNLKFIHVAGTNGKGSVCAYLQAIFTCAGYRVGRFSSPNIINEFDSISIDGKSISEKDYDFYCQTAKNAAENVCSPSDFEILTVASFLFFKAQKCDIVILETGLGGRDDATNIIPPPLYGVLTKISLDHTGYLGTTLKEISEVKCGIIKSGAKTVTTVQNADVERVIKSACREQNSKLLKTENAVSIGFEDIYERFEYKGREYKCGLGGKHQIENATLAIEVAKDFGIKDVCIEKGISIAKNPGRFEKIRENPTVIFDGAHNADGLNALLASLERYYPKKNKTFVVGCMKDKDIKALISLFKSYEEDTLSEFLTVEVGNPRSEKSDALAEQFIKNGFRAKNANNIEQALKIAPNDKLTVVCGSLYLYKELKTDNGKNILALCQ